MENDIKTIVHKEMDCQGVSYRKLAYKAGINHKTTWNWLNGYGTINLKTLIKILTALGLTLKAERRERKDG